MKLRVIFKAINYNYSTSLVDVFIGDRIRFQFYLKASLFYANVTSASRNKVNWDFHKIFRDVKNFPHQRSKLIGVKSEFMTEVSEVNGS